MTWRTRSPVIARSKSQDQRHNQWRLHIKFTCTWTVKGKLPGCSDHIILHRSQVFPIQNHYWIHNKLIQLTDMVQPLDGLVVDKNTTKIDYDSCQQIDSAWFTVYCMDVQPHRARGVCWVCEPGTVGDAWHSLQKIHPIAPNWTESWRRGVPGVLRISSLHDRPGGGHSTFFQVGVCGPDFRSVGLANWHLPLKRGACERKISKFGACELKISNFGGLWAENFQIWGFVS